MSIIIAWLRGKRDYAEGLKIYNQYKFDTKTDQFFAEVLDAKPNSLHHSMLVRKMEYLARVRGNEVVPVVKEAPRKPITNAPINLTGSKNADVSKLRDNVAYVNKTLTLKFKDLTPGDKAIFFGDEKYFLSKQKLMFDNSKIDKKATALHEAMKIAKNDQERQKKLKELQDLDQKKRENWKKVNNWDYKPEDLKKNIKDPVQDAVKEGMEKQKKVDLLKNYIQRAEKEVKSGKLTGKTLEKRQKSIENWKNELKTLVNE